MTGRVSDSPVRAAEGEVLAIADGLPRAEVEQRARQAFEFANEIRACYRRMSDAGKRAAAVSRAWTWADILRHMDATGEPEFCGCICDDTPPAVVRAVWAGWDWLARLTSWVNVAVVIRAFRDVLGAKPIDFYQWPETAEQEPEADKKQQA